MSPTTSDFVHAAEIIRRFPAVTRPTLYRLGMTGAVRVELRPGVPPRYSVEDIAKVYDGQAARKRSRRTPAPNPVPRQPRTPEQMYADALEPYRPPAPAPPASRLPDDVRGPGRC